MDSKVVDNFHAHLEKCVRCANQPFNLCAEGRQLMMEISDAARRGQITMQKKKEEK